MSVRSRRERTVGLLVSIVLLVLIGWAATHRGGNASEREAAALAALESSGIRQAQARVDGMRVTVQGQARDQPQRETALRDVSMVHGIRVVTDRLTVATEEDEPTLTGADTVGSTVPDPPTLLGAAAAPAPPPVPGSASPPRASARTADRRTAEATWNPAEPCAGVPARLRDPSVDFERSSATVQGTSVNLLATVVQHMRACPDTLLEVRGFADQAGSAAENLMLSRQRAHAVVAHLSREGIAADRLVATYKGQQAPGGNEARVTLHTGGSR